MFLFSYTFIEINLYFLKIKKLLKIIFFNILNCFDTKREDAHILALLTSEEDKD